jgi:hypothetical protein
MESSETNQRNTEGDIPTEATGGAGHQLSPLCNACVITQTGIATIPASAVSSDNVGWKAYGLCLVPTQWVPPFFVLAADCFDDANSEPVIQESVMSCLNCIGIDAADQVIVRSSGTSETIRERGRLRSQRCSANNVLSTIRNLIPQLPADIEGRVHWIVQEYSHPIVKGLLSNERRLREEKPCVPQ